MQPYQPRKVEFHQLLAHDDWRVKVYTITHRASFASPSVLANAIANLPQWLAKAAEAKLLHHHIAFLIVHEGRDGMWTLINSWVDENILAQHNVFHALRKSGGFCTVAAGKFYGLRLGDSGAEFRARHVD